MPQKRKRYPLDQCALFKISSPRQLGQRLQIDWLDLEKLLASGSNYNIFTAESNGKRRLVEEPKRRLQALHKRIHDLLARIETPSYLHSAIKGRSYLTNAFAHSGRHAVVKVDVRAFFRSVRRSSVASFFREHMRCAPDVCGLLANLLTIDGHLPTGSSSSPIMSYYAHKDMFDEIHEISLKYGLTMTCYVDDMSLSGPHATRGLLFKVRQIISRHGLSSHKAHYFGPRRPKVITGVVLVGDGVRLPNRRHKKIDDAYKAYRAAPTTEEKLALLPELMSRIYEAASIDPRWRQRALALSAERRLLKSTKSNT